MGAREPRETLRMRLAYEAARIMAEEQLAEAGPACRKAAQRLGCTDSRSWPSRDQVEEALRSQQRLFRGDAQREALAGLRARAMEAMDALAEFRPRLVGPVLDGTADVHSPVELHLFAEDPGAVAMRLAELRIPWRDGERRVRYGGGTRRALPTFRFLAGDTTVDLLVFDVLGLRQPPLAPGSAQPVDRAGPERLRALIAEGEGDRAEP